MSQARALPHISSAARATTLELPDGARVETLLVPASEPRMGLVWLPALGVPARAYLALASQLAGQGISTLVHEWRGIGSSSVRASRRVDWGYAQLLSGDLPATAASAASQFAGLPLCWGGHSLGGQLATLHLARRPQDGSGLVLVGSGAPYWRAQRPPIAAALWAAMAGVPVLTAAMGFLPGRHIGFGGREARGVMRDWLRCVRTGRYDADGLGEDLESALSRLHHPVLALHLRDDAFGPRSALDHLLGKLATPSPRIVMLGPDQLQAPADHFAWMKHPGRVAAEVAGWWAAVSHKAEGPA